MCAEFPSVETQQLDHLSVYTVVKLIMDQLIADTDQKTTMRSLEIHQMHLELALLVKIWHQHPGIKLDQPLTIIMFLSLIQMVEHRVNPIEVNWDLNQGVSIMEINKDLTIEIKMVLLPEANKLGPILVFLLGDSNTLILMKVLTGDILPPTFPSPGFNNTFTNDMVGRSIIQLAENQSHSLDFILARQQSQMDAYKEMTCSNQAR